MVHEIWVPALYRDLTGGVDKVQIGGATVAEVIENLDSQFPGIAARLCDEEENRIRLHIAVAINGIVSTRGLRQKLSEPSEIHFVPAIGGG